MIDGKLIHCQKVLKWYTFTISFIAITQLPILVGFFIWNFYILGNLFVTVVEMRKGGK